jgi:hypothetical protein
MRRSPFTRADILKRESWPEIQAGLRGPESYDELGILSPAQCRQLAQLARVEAEREKTFLNEVVCCINGYRLRKRRHAQESHAAVAESSRRLIATVAAYRRKVLEFPLYMICELKPPLPTDDWFEHAEEMLRRKERLVKGHRSRRLLEPLIMHAWELQKLAGAHSSYLASNWEAMKHWLETAVIASGERPAGKNHKKAYFEGLMLPRNADGSVDLTGRPPLLIALVK